MEINLLIIVKMISVAHGVFYINLYFVIEESKKKQQKYVRSKILIVSSDPSLSCLGPSIVKLRTFF